jgi:hypothetical protein
MGVCVSRNAPASAGDSGNLLDAAVLQVSLSAQKPCSAALRSLQFPAGADAAANPPPIPPNPAAQD